MIHALPPDLFHQENVINIQIKKFNLKVYPWLFVAWNKRVYFELQTLKCATTTVAMFKSVRFMNGIIAFKIVGFDFSTVRFGMWTVRFVSWTVLSFLARYGTLCPRYALLKVTAGFFNSLFAYKRGRRCLNELWCFFACFFFFCFFG